MSPAPKNIVAISDHQEAAGARDPRPRQAVGASTDTAMENTVPASVTPTLTIVARVTWPPLSSSGRRRR